MSTRTHVRVSHCIRTASRSTISFVKDITLYTVSALLVLDIYRTLTKRRKMKHIKHNPRSARPRGYEHRA